MAKIGIESHWLIGARRAHSPNQDVRPIPAAEIDLLVIHSISLPPGSFGEAYIEQFFCNQLDPDAHPYFQGISHLRVSAHLLIYRSGETVQFVPFDQRAWHAGESQYQGRSGCNDFSLGIELEGTDKAPYTDTQYGSLLKSPRVCSEAILACCLQESWATVISLLEEKLTRAPHLIGPRIARFYKAIKARHL
jgi:AmpD protein